ncbi:MAG: hypothetical protein EBE86_019700 [Hormoscilla sp. GUM202]|nr:hypothetical protein [Hormoscilla sp. GUM202]
MRSNSEWRSQNSLSISLFFVAVKSDIVYSCFWVLSLGVGVDFGALLYFAIADLGAIEISPTD